MAEELTDILDDVDPDELDAPSNEIEFVDELPRVSRAQGTGVWAERLAPLRERPTSLEQFEENRNWAKVWGPVKNPHPMVNNLKRGAAAGVNPDEFEFAGRTVDEKGYIFARYLSPEAREARDAAADDEATETE